MTTGRLAGVVAELATEAGTDITTRAMAAADRLDVLVDHAGFGTTGTFRDAPLAQQDGMLRLHVVAVNGLTHEALQLMAPVRSGGISTVSSVASFANSIGNVNYCATKVYQRSFSEGLAIECAPLDIRVQALCPGFTRTAFHRHMAFDQRGRAPDKDVDGGRGGGRNAAAPARG